MDFLGLVERNTAILGKSIFVGGGVDFLGLVERNTAILGGPLKKSVFGRRSGLFGLG